MQLRQKKSLELVSKIKNSVSCLPLKCSDSGFSKLNF